MWALQRPPEEKQEHSDNNRKVFSLCEDGEKDEGLQGKAGGRGGFMRATCDGLLHYGGGGAGEGPHGLKWSR